MKKFYLWSTIIILAAFGIWYFYGLHGSSGLIAQVNYVCPSGASIKAAFYEGESKPGTENEPPVPGGRVEISLSDGRDLILAQTISASGIRYTNDDESLIFWSKGSGAFIMEDGVQQDYADCVMLADDPGGLPQFYVDGEAGFSIRYPEDYTLDDAYQYQYFGPGREINGVKFVIPAILAADTNLSSSDTGVSVETIFNTTDCDAGLFLEGDAEAQDIMDDDREYSWTSRTEGAVGNRYEEEIWAIPGLNSCTAVRYLIHYMDINNYLEGSVTEFDHEALMDQFDSIRRTWVMR